MGQIQTVVNQHTEMAVRPSLDLGLLLQSMIEKGVTSESVDALSRLADLHREQERDRAKRDFSDAFSALQSETRTVNPNRVVPDKQGNLKYRFADYPELMEMVGPLLARHGFSIGWSQAYDSNPIRVIAIGTLRHGTHEVEHRFGVRVGQGPPGVSEAQADAGAFSLAKRHCLCAALNIVVSANNDARAEGDTIDQADAADIERRVKACGADVGRFLGFAGAESFGAIKSGRLPGVLAALLEKERAALARATAEGASGASGAAAPQAGSRRPVGIGSGDAEPPADWKPDPAPAKGGRR